MLEGEAVPFVRAVLIVCLVVPACGGESVPDASENDPAPPQETPTGLVDDAGTATKEPAAAHDGGDASTQDECGTFSTVNDLSATGPFGSTSATEGPGCTIVRPKALGQGGVEHPVILWGNGTGAPVTLYKPAFDLWASHGFIVAAANETNGQGAGTPLLACLDWVLAQNERPGTYYGKVCPRAGATGHSQGGGGALMAGRDPRVRVTAPLQPFTQQGYGGYDQASITTQQGPMLLLSGTADDNATPSIHQKPVFEKTNVPVFWASLIGGDHYTAALGIPNYKTVMLAWFRLYLLGDESLRAQFYGPSCALCTDTKWTVERKAIE